jgi:Leucine-rich repeat (LRR) protein
LDDLDLGFNEISEIDFDELVNLKNINVVSNCLKFVKLPNNLKAVVIDLSGNQISSIEIPNLPNFQNLWINDNLITNININHKNFNIISIFGNKLTNLDLSNVISVNGIDAHSNYLTIITGLEKLSNLKYLDIENNKFTSLNLSNNKEISFLNINNNSIKTLDVSFLKDLRILMNNNPETVIYFKNDNQFQNLSRNFNFPPKQQIRFMILSSQPTSDSG